MDTSKPSWISGLVEWRFSPSSVFGVSKKSGGEPNDRLCSVCSKIKFRKLLKPSIGHPPTAWSQVFDACEAKSNKDCPFYRLIWELSNENKTTNGVPKPGSRIRLTLDFEDSYSILERSPKVYVPSLKVDRIERIQMVGQFGKDFGKLDRSRLFQARPLGRQIDIQLLQHWIQRCEESHDECGKLISVSSGARQYKIRLIDVNKRCVVDATGDYKYVALSYVWGAPEIPQLRLQKGTSARFLTEGGLSSLNKDIPSTIEEAMTLCTMLGRDYLWVDALCIEQDNPADQAVQISQMDKIYANAEFTIISAVGIDVANSWSGLPGVCQSRGPGQRIEKVQELQLANTVINNFAWQVGTVLWNTRAWTLQELHLSTRLIYFTEFECVFQCNQALWKEDQFLEGDKFVNLHTRDEDLMQPLANYRQFFKHKFDKTGLDAFKHYREIVAGISSRAMTNEGDILAAFNGIANVLSVSMGCEFIWGLPATFFDSALLFYSQHSVRSRRRAGFPSWSWTGWKEPHKSHSRTLGSNMTYGEDPDDNYVMCSEVNWHIIRDGQYVQINSSWISRAGDVPSLDSFRSSWRPSQVRELAPILDALAKHERETLLVLQTSCAFIDVVVNDILLAGVCDTLLSVDDKKRVINRRKAAPEHGRSIRQVVETGTEIRRIEFIVLGSFALKDDVKRDESDKEKGSLKLMAIKTDDRGISQRIGIVDDKVYAEEWVAYNPEWRTVFLV